MSIATTNSPFNEAQIQLLNQLLPSLDIYQKAWLAGYISATPQADITSNVETKKVTVLYASQTGNSQQLAETLGERLRQANVETTVVSTAKFKTNQLKKLTNLIVIASTHGEGEPPDNAIPFYEFLHSSRAPKLSHLNYAVLALGDSSYEFFCKTGADFDQQLEKLGAKRLISRVDCDVAYEEDAARFIDDIIEQVAQVNVPTIQSNATVNEASVYTKSQPFYAEVVDKFVLNGRGSSKHTMHIELSLEGANLTYEPGDSVGILSKNNAALVEQVAAALTFTDEKPENLQQQLVTKEITQLTKPLFEKLKNYSKNEAFLALAWQDYHYGRDLLDVLTTYGPFEWTSEQFLALLRDLPPRLYSIASSQLANEESVHLTISKVAYETDGRERLGVCSGQIAEQIEVGDQLPIYIHHNPNFSLPKDETPIIMIGAGTGVAPFRSFIEERAERQQTSDAWLFFGDQHFVTDFLYQTDWQQWLEEGALTDISLAFSRDQATKIYVQHRLAEQAEKVYEWLQRGAIIYVCGDKDAMAKDVEQTLLTIIKEQGACTDEEANAYLTELRQNNRYQRDVY